MYLISTGKTTVLSDFSNLDTKSIYQHANGETTDFQFYARQRIFLEVNKKSGLEIMRIKDKGNNNLNIQRVRKLNIGNVYSAACAKQSMEEMAFGGVNGQVSIYNYKNSELVHRFKADNNRNSVLYLDYNGTDEYISSVFENGHINIYGTKTKTKIDSVNIDGNSTLARFHPTKRFQFSIASFKGAVTVYDLQTKRKIFNLNDAHASPCRDLCMSAATPDSLISVGYDCIVNVFDTRRRTPQMKLNHPHPLSTVAMSGCGTYFCVGNLKGELISYDIRSVKKCLATKKVHDCSVTRLSFVPLSEDDGSTTSSFSGTIANNTDSPTEYLGEQQKSTATMRQRDSFCDFLDFQANKLDRMSARFTMRRDSFDWDTLGRKPKTEDTTPTASKLNGSSENLNESTEKSTENISNGKLNMSFDYVNTRRKKIEDGKKPYTTPLRDRNSISKMVTNLKQIEEEESSHILHQNNVSNTSDKENPSNAEMDFDTHGQLRKPLNAYSSTPNHTPIDSIKVKKLDQVKSEIITENNNVETINTTENNHSENVNITATPSDILQHIADLRLEMNTRFQKLESEVKVNAEQNKWQIFTQIADIWARQMNTSEDIRDALSYLLQTDPFVNEFLRLKDENELLKAQLQQIMEKK
ncbi:uncharacterized protein LOC105231216 [Bactrocera dorsalis]|uniref:Uncharacterized protein LOC105231216 n=1 Tax=Bactrocera dorsalis TaxID=27457 RepID=A0A9B2H4W0_BACDO|nr:uncharacterized protein LOC105231216 [Bactrocera dorsalis]